jgi:O-antigen ligase
VRSPAAQAADPGAGKRLGAALAMGAVCLLAAVTILGSASMGAKWLLLMMAAIMAGCAWVLAPDRRLYAVCGIAACIPIGIQYGLWSHGNRTFTYQHFGGAPAEPVINLVDAPIALMALMWIVDLTHGRRRLPAWNCLDTVIGIFLLLGLASLVNSTEPALLTFELLRYAKYLLLYWMLRTYLDRPNRLWFVIAASLGVACFQGLVAMAQYVFNLTLPVPVGGVSESAFELVGGEVIQRVTGFLGHSNTFAAYLLVPIAFAGVLLVSRVAVIWRLLALPALGLALTALVLTFSRNGLLSLAFLAVMVVSLALATRRLPRASLAVGAMACLLVVLLVFGFGLDLTTLRSWHVAPEGLRSGLIGTVVTRIVYDPGKAVDSRLDLLRIAAEMVRQHPLFGIGLNSFEENMALYDRTGTVNIIQQPVHNIYMLVAAETGLPSLIAFLALGCMLARRAWRLVGAEGEACFVAGALGLCALGALGFANMLDVTMRKEPLVGMLTLIAAIIVSAPSWSDEAVEHRPQKSGR